MIVHSKRIMAPVLAMKRTPKKTGAELIKGNLLTVAQAAADLGVSRQNIHDAIARGRLIASRLGSILVIERSSLQSYGKSRRRTGRPRKRPKSP